MRRLWPLLLLALASCGDGPERYFPLQEGNEWLYSVSFDPDSATMALRVVGRAPVGGQNGWLLHSEMGDCRLAWAGDELLAAELAGTAYSPPIPIFAPDGTEWQGVVSTPVGKTSATAKLTKATEDIKVGGVTHSTVKCVLTLEGDERLQLTTWFFPGLGILRQEQRSGPALVRDRKIEHVRGPT